MSIFLKRILLAVVIFALGAFISVGSANAEVNAKYSISGDDALNNLKKDAAEGNIQAAYKLGIIYLTGNGVTASKNEALKYIRKAAQGKDAKAQILIAAAYAFPHLMGINVQDQDLPTVRFMLNKASGMTIKKDKDTITVSDPKDKFAARMVAYLDLLGLEGIKRTEQQIEDGKKTAEAIFEKLGINKDEYQVPEGTTFRQILENGLEKAYGLEIRDGNAVSFDDSNYPG